MFFDFAPLSMQMPMTNLMEEAIDVLRHVPPEQQDEIARVVMQLAGKGYPVYELNDEAKADIDAGIGEIERGEVAADEQVRAIWAKHGL